MLSKKEKGDIGLSYAIAVSTEQGWSCCIPLSEHQRYDFIAEKDGICKRIQARYTTPNNEVLVIKLKNSWADKNGNHIIKRQKGDFDYLAVFNPQNKKVYFISDDDFENGTAINLRLVPPKNGQKKGIRMANDFLTLK